MWRSGPHGVGRVAYFARVRYGCARVGCADEEACHKGLKSVGGMPVGGHLLPILSTIFGHCFGVLRDEPSFMQIGSYVSRIAVGRFMRKTSERAAFMVMIMPRTCSQLEGGDHKTPLPACRPCGYRYRCSVLCSKNTSVYTSSDAQFVRVFRTSHGFLFSGKRLSPFSFLNSLLILSTSTFSHRAQNLDSCTPKRGTHVCSSCIR